MILLSRPLNLDVVERPDDRGGGRRRAHAEGKETADYLNSSTEAKGPDGGSGVVKKFQCNANLGVVARGIKSYDGKLDRGSTLVVTMASSGQLQLLRIWLDARERRQLVVIALDEETVNECCKLGIAYLYDEKLQARDWTGHAFHER